MHQTIDKHVRQGPEDLTNYFKPPTMKTTSTLLAIALTLSLSLNQAFSQCENVISFSSKIISPENLESSESIIIDSDNNIVCLGYLHAPIINSYGGTDLDHKSAVIQRFDINGEINSTGISFTNWLYSDGIISLDYTDPEFKMKIIEYRPEHFLAVYTSNIHGGHQPLLIITALRSDGAVLFTSGRAIRSTLEDVKQLENGEVIISVTFDGLFRVNFESGEIEEISNKYLGQKEIHHSPFVDQTGNDIHYTIQWFEKRPVFQLLDEDFELISIMIFDSDFYFDKAISTVSTHRAGKLSGVHNYELNALKQSFLFTAEDDAPDGEIWNRLLELKTQNGDHIDYEITQISMHNNDFILLGKYRKPGNIYDQSFIVKVPKSVEDEQLNVISFIEEDMPVFANEMAINKESIFLTGVQYAENDTIPWLAKIDSNLEHYSASCSDVMRMHVSTTAVNKSSGYYPLPDRNFWNQPYYNDFSTDSGVRYLEQNFCHQTCGDLEAKPRDLTNSEKSSVLIYPNPSSNRIYIQADRSKNANYILYSLNGKKLQQGSIINQQIDVSSHSTGIYLLKLISGSEEKTVKLMVE